MLSSVCFVAAIVGILVESVLIIVSYLNDLGGIAAAAASIPSIFYGVGLVTFPLALMFTLTSGSIGLASLLQMLLLFSFLLPLIGCIFIELFVEGAGLAIVISAGVGLTACTAAIPCLGPMVAPIIGIITILNLKAAISLCALMVAAVNTTMSVILVFGLLVLLLIALSLLLYIVFEVCCITVNEICTLTCTAGAGAGCCFSMLAVFIMVSVIYGFALVLCGIPTCGVGAVPISVVYFVCILTVMTCFPPAALPFIGVAFISICLCAGGMFITLLICLISSIIVSIMCVTVVMGSMMGLAAMGSCTLFACLECVIWNIGISAFGIILVLSLLMVGPILCMVEIITCIIGLTIAPMFILPLLIVLLIAMIGYTLVQRVFGG